MLAVEVQFLTGRFVATAYNSRRGVEWPPHPARLFSALVAAHFEAGEVSAAERDALEWLEAQAPPAIRSSEASVRDLTTVFVPVNDTTVVGGFDKQEGVVEAAQEQVAQAQAAGDAKAVRVADKALTKAKDALSKAVTGAIAAPEKLSKDGPATALSILPEHRGRQPRTFPSVTPVDPAVTYIWPDAAPTAAVKSGLEAVLGRLVRLGHSSTLVHARLVERPPAPRWRPSEDGELMLRTVQPGQLAALERGHALHRETEPRVMPAVFQPYTERQPSKGRPLAASAFGEDWLVLRRVGGPQLPMVATVGVARAVRGALLRFAPQPVAEVISGHKAGGEASERDHLAIVPLSFVGHLHASGAILGVALILPRGATAEDRQAVYRAVGAWEAAQRAPGDLEDAPALPVRLGRAGVLELERVDWGRVPQALVAATWSAASRVWWSVTPVALDRNPGQLRSRDSGQALAARTSAEETVRLACARIGLPAPAAVEILPAAPVSGAAKAQAFPAYPPDRERTQRVLTHVRLEFAEPVRGPVLLGAGRYLGLGLFRPEEVHE
jgi:CRISPR-associated protein Csb2